MSLKKLIYIYIEEGEFLYDQLTSKVYTFTSPHSLVGYIDKDYNLIKK
jgi:hypothetical protein